MRIVTAWLFLSNFIEMSCTEYRYEILSADEGDKEKLQQFYDACDGITQVASLNGFCTHQFNRDISLLLSG